MPRLQVHRQRTGCSRRAGVLVLVGATILAVLLGEVVLVPVDVLKPRPRAEVGEYEFVPNGFLVPDPQIGWRMQATESGFRTPTEFQPLDHRKKIVLVGDSFTWGSGVQYEDTFGVAVEDALSDTVVYNMGMPGFGVDQIWLTARHKALPLKPDLLIAGICDCDFSRSQTAYRSFERMTKPVFKLDKGQLVPRTPGDTRSKLVRLLDHHSRFWTGWRLFQHAVSYHVPFGEWWFLNEAILDAMRADAASHHVPILFLYIPSVEWRSFPSLHRYMNRTGAEYINLQEGAPADVRALYDSGPFPHFNRTGHDYVASRILDWIRMNW